MEGQEKTVRGIKTFLKTLVTVVLFIIYMFPFYMIVLNAFKHKRDIIKMPLSVPALDSTAMNALQNLVKTCEDKGITLVFSHVNEQPMHVMEKAGFVELVGKENFQSNISAALKRAEEVI